MEGNSVVAVVVNVDEHGVASPDPNLGSRKASVHSQDALGTAYLGEIRLLQLHRSPPELSSPEI